MAGTAKATTDHAEIREWVEARGGHPAAVAETGKGEDDVGIIRIDFPGYSGDKLRPISWDEWFEEFDKRKLAFLHQDEKDGHESRFNKLVSRESVKERAEAHHAH